MPQDLRAAWQQGPEARRRAFLWGFRRAVIRGGHPLSGGGEGPNERGRGRLGWAAGGGGCGAPGMPRGLHGRRGRVTCPEETSPEFCLRGFASLRAGARLRLPYPA